MSSCVISATGRETAIASTPLRESHPLFTAGGTQVALAQYVQTAPAAPGFKVFSYPTIGGAPQLRAEISTGRFDQLSEDGRFRRTACRT